MDMLHPEYKRVDDGIFFEAARWWQNGDHPRDEYLPPSPNEGKLVRRFRNPYVESTYPCKLCGCFMHDHGWIDCGVAGLTVCPGDWVLIAEDGHFEVVKNDEFKKHYRRVI